jgi:ribosome-associated translation inhibitor RaiA
LLAIGAGDKNQMESRLSQFNHSTAAYPLPRKTTLMHIQVNTDRNTEGSEKLSQYVEETVEHTLNRFSDRITRVEVFLSDQNSSQKGGDNDKRCVMEARLAGLQPITVSDDSATYDQALDGAVKKMRKTLSRTLERLEDPKNNISFGGDQVI